MASSNLIWIDELNGRKYLVIDTGTPHCEYDPQIQKTAKAWEELRQHMNRKSWWTIEHELEFQDLQAEYSK